MAINSFFTLLFVLVVESYSQNCSHGDMRLRGGTVFTGRVEVCANGTWGTICDRQWDHQDARVVCNQLNFSYPDNTTQVSASCGSACFGEGSGAVHYRDVNCTATDYFSQCSNDTVGNGSCSNHSRDAGVICAVFNTTSDMETAAATTIANQTGNTTISIGILGAIVGVLAMALLAVGIGWMVTCYRAKRMSLRENKVGHSRNEYSQSYSRRTPTEEYNSLEFATAPPKVAISSHDITYDTVEINSAIGPSTHRPENYIGEYRELEDENTTS